MRKETPYEYKADATASRFHQPPMSSTRPTLPGNNVDEEIQVSVGDVRYLLIPNKENVLRRQVKKNSLLIALDFFPRCQS